jgi:hypothetical protein
MTDQVRRPRSLHDVTVDDARRWKARAEKAEAENERLREAAQHAVDVAREFSSTLRLPEFVERLRAALAFDETEPTEENR